MSCAISVQGISKHFGALLALNHVSFDIEQGEFFALLGPNGAGKTTLISALAGLGKQSSGSISVMGYDTQKAPYRARMNLGVVPQELVFDPFFNVRETLVFQSGYFGIRQNTAWIEELLERLGLADKARTNSRALSGGMKRRLMVAQALVHKPPVIVLDEPTAGVDVELRQSLWTFIQELNQAGHTILLTTHYLEEAQMLCNRIAMMKHGQLIALAPTQELLHRDDRHEVSLKLSAALPLDLMPRCIQERDGWTTLKLENLAQLEQILASLRIAGVNVQQISIPESNLEDVFISIMKESD